MVDTQKSPKILPNALTWFLARTVPNSKKAKPACIAKIITEPNNRNNTSKLECNGAFIHFTLANRLP